MRRVRATSKLTRGELAVGIGVLTMALLLVGLILRLGGRGYRLAEQRCPIDGMAAEWASRPYGTNLCNYGHFSVVERQAHTWWGAC